MADKPGITTLAQLEEVRRVQAETKRIYSICYSERLENKATVKAGELVQAGAIGRVVQTVGLGPTATSQPPGVVLREGAVRGDPLRHRVPPVRPVPLLHRLHEGGSGGVAGRERQPPAAPRPRGLRGRDGAWDGGSGYIRVDWFTPGGLKTWGDGRLTILGTDGFIEIRKNIDLAGREGGNHLFLVDQKETRHVDCTDVALPYGSQLVDDVLNRTQTAMPQAHCFLATELAIRAQANAQKVRFRA